MMKKTIVSLLCAVLSFGVLLSCTSKNPEKGAVPLKLRDGVEITLYQTGGGSDSARVTVSEYIDENDAADVTYRVAADDTGIVNLSAVTGGAFTVTAAAVGSTTVRLRAMQGGSEAVGIAFPVKVLSGSEVDLSYRQDRSFTDLPEPSNEVREEELPVCTENSFVTIGDTLSLVNGEMRLDFMPENGKYSVSFVSLKKLAGSGSIDAAVQKKATADSIIFSQENPLSANIQRSGASANRIAAKYDAVERTAYGYLASAEISTANGSALVFEDRYFLAAENEPDAFAVRKSLSAKSVRSSDIGFSSAVIVTAQSSDGAGTNWFIPNRVYKNYGFTTSGTIYNETELGLGMAMMYDPALDFSMSIARYQPVIHYKNNHYASIAISRTGGAEGKPMAEVTYPSRKGSQLYHEMKNGARHVFDVVIRGDVADSYDTASYEGYNAHFNLQNQRIVNTDIDEVFKVINEDFKTFLVRTPQTRDGIRYYSYGLPWSIVIRDPSTDHLTGRPLTYQAGFVGQQIPAGYNMMHYGLLNDDLESLQNGVNVIDFWVTSTEFMTTYGLPRIWYDVYQQVGSNAGGFRPYPTFTRMAVDCMEGLLDGFRIAEAHGIDRPEWYEACVAFGDFLVDFQNADGSYYRCYNQSGGPYVPGDDGITVTGDIYQSESKHNTTMPVRYLAKMYELTGDESYKTAALKAGKYVYDNLYPDGTYRGGTCDNPNKIDKEAGVFAMYCYDALYSLTGEAKWLECLKQASAFTMATAQAFSFPIRPSDWQASYPLQYGYNDGCSFISTVDTGMDNYIAFAVYQMFRTYVWTGERSYLKQSEFLQQNTKSIMNWDGALNYRYKSLLAEATSISDFNFGSAENGAWLPWSSVANIEPISKMLDAFGAGDVGLFANTDIGVLRERLTDAGVGGKAHRVYKNTVADKVVYQTNY